MGIFDKIRKAATKAVDEQGDAIGKGIDKATAAADTRTQGKQTDRLDQASRAAKDALDRLDGRNDDIPPSAPRRP